MGFEQGKAMALYITLHYITLHYIYLADAFFQINLQ